MDAIPTIIAGRRNVMLCKTPINGTQNRVAQRLHGACIVHGARSDRIANVLLFDPLVRRLALAIAFACTGLRRLRLACAFLGFLCLLVPVLANGLAVSHAVLKRVIIVRPFDVAPLITYFVVAINFCEVVMRAVGAMLHEVAQHFVGVNERPHASVSEVMVLASLVSERA